MGDDGFFDERVAGTYDDPDDPMFDPAAIDPVVDVLVELAGEGRALELAIGTGRIALPLAARGVDVHGIELSRAMVARLRDEARRRPDRRVDRRHDDHATAGDLPRRLPRVQHDHEPDDAGRADRVLRQRGAHLSPGGRFVVEVMVPQLRRLPPGETVHPFHVADDHLGLDEYDVVTQRLVSHHVSFRDGRAERSAVPFRYVWPSELDLMARLAGMTLEHRWGDWRREPFTAESTDHVSVWQVPVDA